MPKGTIILLNGASSSGKSTLSLALQAKLERPAYHLAQDAFHQMASKTHRQADFWAVTASTILAMHHTIALFSNLGLDVIVDHVILDRPPEHLWLRECVRLLHAHPVLFVRVECPLAELERREQQRGDRRAGQARAQIDRIHEHGVYDLTVNTATQTLEMCTDLILAALTDPTRWRAFRTLYQHWTAAA
jgi:chloramphenicol 3-O phosphotransferase